MRTIISVISVFLLAGPAYAGEVSFECHNTYPSDHEGLQTLLDAVAEGTVVQIEGTCEFEPPDVSLAGGSVSILKDGIELRGPAVIHGGARPIRIGGQTPYGEFSFCSDPDTTCVQVSNVTVRELELISPLDTAITIDAAEDNLVITENVILGVRPVIIDYTPIGFPFQENAGTCVEIAPTLNDFPAGPDLINGDIRIVENRCMGGATISDVNDPEAVLDVRPFAPPGQYIKGALRGIYIANVNARVVIQQNHLENTFGPAIFYNADSPGFAIRADALRVEVFENSVIQDSPDIVAGGFFPIGMLARLDPTVNAGPHIIAENEVVIDDDLVGLGSGIEAWGLVDADIRENEVHIIGNGIFSLGITVTGSRQGPSGPGVVVENEVSGTATVGILIGDGDPLFGNPPGLFGITSDIAIEENDFEDLTSTFVDILLQSDTTELTVIAENDDTVLDFGVDNEVVFDD